jgi:hypothetical protein
VIEIALTDAEFVAAEAVAAEMHGYEVPDFATLHARCDANVVLRDCMTTQGLDVLSDLAAASRVVATADLLALPEVVTEDTNGSRLHCGDCSRPMAYDYRSEEYRHLVNPTRGCFLIPPEIASGPKPLLPEQPGDGGLEL